MAAAKRLKAIYENYLEARREGPKYGYDIRAVEQDNYEHYYILVKPLAGVYAGQKYIMEMKTTYGRGADEVKYPNNAPYIHFITNILHVNISANGGSICLDILKDKDKWSPLNSFDTIVQNILLLFNEPNNASPYNGEASRQWVECEKKYKENKKPGTVAEMEALYMMCFAPFIESAERIQRSNNLKKYAKWFPELDIECPEYKERVAAAADELTELEAAFVKMKVKHSVNSVAEPGVAPAAGSDVKHSVVPPAVKRNRWEKYQK